MKSYIVFLKKEYVESVRNFRFLVLGFVFLQIAVMSPAAARYLPEIIAEFMPADINIVITEPAPADAWLQFVKNFSQIGLIVLVIMYSQILSSEYGKGTLLCLLAKGMPRKNIILAKLTAACLFWTAAFWISAAVCLGCTMLFWHSGAAPEGLAACLCGLWLFGLWLLAAVILGGALFESAYGCLLFAGAAVLIQAAASLLPKAGQYLPLGLISDTTALLARNSLPEAYWIRTGTAVAAAAVFTVCSVAAFEKRQF